MNNFTFGHDAFAYYETIGGGSGATAEADGADAVHTHMTNTRLTDPEVIEHRYPVRIRFDGGNELEVVKLAKGKEVPLNGSEELVVSSKGEIAEGQRVRSPRSSE